MWCWNPITFSLFSTVCGRWFPITHQSNVWSAVHSHRNFSHGHFFTIWNKSDISSEPVAIVACHRRSSGWCNAWCPWGASSTWSQRTPQIYYKWAAVFHLGKFKLLDQNFRLWLSRCFQQTISSATLNSNTCNSDTSYIHYHWIITLMYTVSINFVSIRLFFLHFYCYGNIWTASYSNSKFPKHLPSAKHHDPTVSGIFFKSSGMFL